MTLALYPGSFDPVTNGHVNLIHRGRKLCDRLIVAVANNSRKQPLFSVAERTEMLAEALAGADVEVTSFSGLLVEYARVCGADVILRGLRAVSDFEFEFQLAHMNRRLGGGLETMFMMTGEEHFYVSSNLVREIAQFSGNVAGLVPAGVEAALRRKFSC